MIWMMNKKQDWFNNFKIQILLWNQLWIVLLKTFKVISKTLSILQIFSKVLLISQKKSLGIHTYCFHSKLQTKLFKVNNYWIKIKSKFLILIFQIFFRQFMKEKLSKLMKKLTNFSKLVKKKSRPFEKRKTNLKPISIHSLTSTFKRKLIACISPNSFQTRFSKAKKCQIRKNLSSF
jgi:hypothetical protein